MTTWSLVTGASGGLGLEIARRLAKRGDSLVITARSREKLGAAAAELRSLGAPEVRVVVADLATREGALHLLDDIAANSITISTLVNNAGFGLTGSFLGQDEAELLEMVELNVTTLTLLTRRLVPAMVAAGSGAVLNLSSVAGFQPGPFMAVYYATKAYVLSLSEALREELRGTGVSVVTLCPGPTHTGFAERSGMDHGGALRAAVTDASAVVDAGIAALDRGGLVIPGAVNKLLVQSQRLLPRSVPLRISRGLNLGRSTRV